jgi:ATP-binding cassette, subfamily C, bacterial
MEAGTGGGGTRRAIAFSLNFLVRTSKKAGRRQTQRTSELVIYLSDALSNIKPLKAMAKSGKFANLFQVKIGQLRRACGARSSASMLLRI